MQTSWNLKKHFYSSLKDPRIQKDLARIRRAYRTFEKKWRTSDAYLGNEKELLEILQDFEKLTDVVGSKKPLRYLFFVQSLDAKNKDVVALQNKFSYELKQEGARILFFRTKISKIAAAQQKKFLRSKTLAPYRFLLKEMFDAGKYTLSEPEERISRFLSEPAADLWEKGSERVLHSMSIVFEKKTIPLSKAMELMRVLPRVKRKKLYRSILNVTKTHGAFAESELNALVIYHRIQDNLRGYKIPQEAAVRGHNTDPKTVDTLVKTVTERFDIAHRFFEAKRKFLKLKKMDYDDRLEKIGTIQRVIPFTKAVKILRETLAKVDTRYAAIFDSMLENGQIDAYPKEGKSGGGFCARILHGPTFILLNYVDALSSFKTLAHEMGHAIHSERIKVQPTRYQGYSTATAETASTFFEKMGAAALETTMSDKERLVLLHDRIDDAISTVFRQVACFNFEREMHETIRQKGALSKEELARMMQKNLAAYLGRAFAITEEDGYAFISWPHIRYNFYVYTYAYGFLVSQGLYKRYTEDSSYIKKIDQFLSAGESDTVENIFKKIGINLRTASFWREALSAVEKDVVEFEKLVAKVSKK